MSPCSRRATGWSPCPWMAWRRRCAAARWNCRRWAAGWTPTSRTFSRRPRQAGTRPACSRTKSGLLGPGQDVDDEDQGVRAVDAGLRRPGLTVAVGGRDDEQHPAADRLADQPGVPALDDLADADVQRERRAARPRGVEDLLGPPVDASVLDHDVVALGDRLAGALDKGLDLQ